MPVFGWMATIEQTVNSLFAGQKTLQSAYKLVNLTVQGLWVDDDELIYDRGIYKGQDKRAVALRQAVPVLQDRNAPCLFPCVFRIDHRVDDGICQFIDSFFQFFTSLNIEFNFFCHSSLPNKVKH